MEFFKQVFSDAIHLTEFAFFLKYWWMYLLTVLLVGTALWVIDKRYKRK